MSSSIWFRHLSAVEIAVGLSVAQQILQQQGFRRSAAPSSSGPELMSPAEVAGVLGVPEQDVMSIIDSGELAAQENWRVVPDQAIRPGELSESLMLVERIHHSTTAITWKGCADGP